MNTRILVGAIMLMGLSGCAEQKMQSGECANQELIAHKRDQELQTAVAALVKRYLVERKWSTVTVYVVETQTGKMRTRVSLNRNGEKVEPYEDTYMYKQNQMLCAPTYLALLTTEKVTSESWFDTGPGIYGEVKDHNWQHGGYGKLTLEKALCVRSQVAFTMAREYVWGDSKAEYEAKMNRYLGSEPYCATDVLTFYNAVANGGRMLKLVSEGEGSIVLDGHIAPLQHVKALQDGLERCVSQGVFRHVGRNYTKVAACGCTFMKEGETRRMELCGYFPADKAKYTLMVIIEKDGLPAGATYMCGPLMVDVIDFLANE